MEVKFFSSYSEFKSLRSSWEDLEKLDRKASIFQTFAWQKAWLDTFDPNAQLAVFTAWKAGLLVGIAPLLFRHANIHGRKELVLQWIGTENLAADYGSMLLHPDHPEAKTSLCRAILDEPAWTLLLLFQVPEAVSLEEDLRAQSTLPVFSRTTSEAPARRLDDEKENEKIFRKKSMKRAYNYFQREGELHFSRMSNLDEAKAHSEPFFRQHRERWGDTPSPSLFHDQEQCAFYKRLIEELLPQGKLHFSVVTYNEAPIAYHFGFEWQGVLTWYKPSFDPALAKRSPGEVLLRFLFEDAIHSKLRELDFTIGEEKFKYRYANTIRRNQEIRIYRRPLSQLLWRMRTAARRVKKRFPR